MKRENGFYYVNLQGEWIIAQWNGKLFLLPGIETAFHDLDFREIDERKINRLI